MQETSKTAIFLFKNKQRRNPGEVLKLETSKACQDTCTRQILSKKMRISLLTSFLQGLMILSKNLIFHP